MAVLMATLGGALIGLATAMLLLFNGRLAGISGLVGGIPSAASGDRAWRVFFLAGLLSGGAAMLAFDRTSLALASEQSIGAAVVAGVLVGVGTRMGSGCTSGHGICGISRLSRRSIAATLTFMAAGALTVFLVRHVLYAWGGGAP
jgi:uncharacterized protein